jgi:hypothetical protein
LQLFVVNTSHPFFLFINFFYLLGTNFEAQIKHDGKESKFVITFQEGAVSSSASASTLSFERTLTQAIRDRANWTPSLDVGMVEACVEYLSQGRLNCERRRKEVVLLF